ncbi:MAG: type IV secretory system conjugative DNA transfer family protein [Ruminococcus sp.]|nr:type IV secretory system conjugative DNA transfer family protein [Ruminococcus sp.]
MSEVYGVLNNFISDSFNILQAEDQIQAIIDKTAKSQGEQLAEKMFADKVEALTLTVIQNYREILSVKRYEKLTSSFPFVSDSITVNGIDLTRETMFPRTIRVDDDFADFKLILNPYNDRWFREQKNGASKFVSNLNVTACFVVNATGPGCCTAFLVYVFGRDEPLVFANGNLCDAYINRKIINEKNSHDKWAAEAFRRSLFRCSKVKFLSLPQHAGWNVSATGSLVFTSSELMNAHLQALYSQSDIHIHNPFLNIMLDPTERTLEEIIDDYHSLVPDVIPTKAATSLSLMSSLQPFFQENGLIQDRYWVYEASDEKTSEALIALTQNATHSSLNTLFSSDRKNIIEANISKSIDCTLLIRHSSYVDNKYDLDKIRKILLKIIQNKSDENAEYRTVPILLTDDACVLPEEEPCYCLSVTEELEFHDVTAVQHVLGELQYVFIRYAEKNPDSIRKDINFAIDMAQELLKSAPRNAKSNSAIMLVATAILLKTNHVFNGQDIMGLIEWIKLNASSKKSFSSSIQTLVSEILSRALCADKIPLANQFGFPFWSPDKAFISSNDFSINMTTELFDGDIVNELPIDLTSNKVLKYLEQSEKIITNPREYQRTLTLYSEDGRKITRRFISLSCDILNSDARRKVDEIFASDLFYKTDEVIPYFFPYIKHCSLDMVAGQVVKDYNKLNPFICVTGGPGSRKTTFLLMQAIQRALRDETVIVFDPSNAFCPDELYEHRIPQEIVQNHFVHWDIGKKGWPVELVDSNESMSTEEQHQAVYSMLVSGLHLTGSSQLSKLNNKIAAWIKEYTNTSRSDICDVCRYFDKSDDKENAVLERLKALFHNIPASDSNQSWDDIVHMKGKIFVISNGLSTANKDVNVLDVVLDSFYCYKDKHRNDNITLIVDEVQKMNLRTDSPINCILSLGRKLNIAMIISSQMYSKGTDDLARTQGYCDTKFFFRPMDSCLEAVSATTGIPVDELSLFEDGYCAITGSLYCRSKGRNTPVKAPVRGFIFRLPELGPYDTNVSDQSCEEDNNVIKKGLKKRNYPSFREFLARNDALKYNQEVKNDGKEEAEDYAVPQDLV